MLDTDVGVQAVKMSQELVQNHYCKLSNRRLLTTGFYGKLWSWWIDL